MRKITKEFKKTTINAVRVVVLNGEVVHEALAPIETFETITERNSAKVVKTTLSLPKADIVVVKNFVETVEKYTISAEDFMKYGTKIDG
jgi:hypothetical protein|nr:MAG TPA: Histone-like Protein p6 [Caudoviricetes sp.]